MKIWPFIIKRKGINLVLKLIGVENPIFTKMKKYWDLLHPIIGSLVAPQLSCQIFSRSLLKFLCFRWYFFPGETAKIGVKPKTLKINSKPAQQQITDIFVTIFRLILRTQGKTF